MVRLEIISELCSTSREIPLSLTWSQLAEKLYEATGVLPRDMNLVFTMKDGSQKTIDYDLTKVKSELHETLSPDVKEVRVIDVNGSSIVNKLKQEFDTSEPIEGFQLSDSDYAKRQDSVLQWKRENQLGSFNPEFKVKLAEARTRQETAAKKLVVGERCAVRAPEKPERRGWLRYIGKVADLGTSDIWCGVEFDEPVGKNNGTFKGTTYFGPVKQNYGAFVKPVNVITSPEFVPLLDDLFDDDDEL